MVLRTESMRPEAVLAVLGLVAVVASGCSTHRTSMMEPDPPGNGDPAVVKGAQGLEPSARDRARGLDKADKRAAAAQARAREQQLRRAYSRGVRDTMEDYKGRMRAQQGFVWEPPMVEYVEMPARKRGGAIYPSHVEPVVIKPGHWEERNGTRLPREPQPRRRVR